MTPPVLVRCGSAVQWVLDQCRDLFSRKCEHDPITKSPAKPGFLVNPRVLTSGFTAYDADQISIVETAKNHRYLLKKDKFAQHWSFHSIQSTFFHVLDKKLLRCTELVQEYFLLGSNALDDIEAKFLVI